MIVSGGETLGTILHTYFVMKDKMGYSAHEVDDMTPFEREIMMSLWVKARKDDKEAKNVAGVF